MFLNFDDLPQVLNLASAGNIDYGEVSGGLEASRIYSNRGHLEVKMMVRSRALQPPHTNDEVKLVFGWRREYA